MTKTVKQNSARGALIQDAQEVAHLDELDFSDPLRPSFGEENSAQKIFSKNDGGQLTDDISVAGELPSDDDLTPEQLMPEDGARSPAEPGDGDATDETLRIVGEDEIGGGDGLDEAELARAQPLDGKRWDGDATQPLSAAEPIGEDFPVSDVPPVDDRLEDEGDDKDVDE